MDKLFTVLGLLFVILVIIFILALMYGKVGMTMTNLQTGEKKKYGSCKDEEDDAGS